jgi:hypothetical protein
MGFMKGEKKCQKGDKYEEKCRSRNSNNKNSN